MLPEISIEMRYNDEGEQRMFLDGEDVSAEIRMPEISICASNVSAMPAVRAYLLEMQRRMARTHNVIMDGRDIGTVVLPDAELKIFLTASAAARAQRRLLELQGKSVKADYDEVLRDIEYRDKQDTSRATAPLKAAEDAVRVDTSDIDFEQSAALPSEHRAGAGWAYEEAYCRKKCGILLRREQIRENGGGAAPQRRKVQQPRRAYP